MMGFIRRAFAGFIVLSAIAALRTFAEPPLAADNAATLRWKSSVVRIALSSSLTNANPNIKFGTDVSDVVRRSLAAWENVSNIKFVAVPSEKQNVSPSGVSGDGVSLITIAQTPENLALFQSDPQTISARTRVFYNRRGEITEADIVLSPFVQFSDDGTMGTFDLQSTLTHEIGHLLGLEHSLSLGAAMYENSGRNGLFGLQVRSGRILSSEDIAALQRLYPFQADDQTCCGAAVGHLSIPVSRRAIGYQVWAEDAETGRVSASVTSLKGGIFRLEGLPIGGYRVYAQDPARKRAGTSSLEIGEVQVDKGKVATVDIASAKKAADTDVHFIGLNGQLAEAPVPVNSGRMYVMYFGGTNLNASKLTIGSTSRFITVNSATVSNFDFNDNVTAVRAEVTIDPEAPLGDYSIYLQNEGGNRRYIVGAIKVSAFVDPWDISSIFLK